MHTYKPKNLFLSKSYYFFWQPTFAVEKKRTRIISILTRADFSSRARTKSTYTSVPKKRRVLMKPPKRVRELTF